VHRFVVVLMSEERGGALLTSGELQYPVSHTCFQTRKKGVPQGASNQNSAAIMQAARPAADAWRNMSDAESRVTCGMGKANDGVDKIRGNATGHHR
jgi:hypothetical protein